MSYVLAVGLFLIWVTLCSILTQAKRMANAQEHISASQEALAHPHWLLHREEGEEIRGS